MPWRVRDGSAWSVKRPLEQDADSETQESHNSEHPRPASDAAVTSLPMFCRALPPLATTALQAAAPQHFPGIQTAFCTQA